MTTTKQHTPGPWRWLSAEALVGDHGGRPVVISADEGKIEVRDERGLLGPLRKDHPDALLIAAAPELLAALKHLAGLFQGLHPNASDWGDYNAARAAIAKAEGQPARAQTEGA